MPIEKESVNARASASPRGFGHAGGSRPGMVNSRSIRNPWQHLKKLRNLARDGIQDHFLADLRRTSMRIIAFERSFLMLKFLLTAACLSALPARADNGAAFLEKLSLNSSLSKTLIVYHGFGCAYRNQFALTPARLSYLQSQLGAAHSAKEERKILAKVVAWFDREAGRMAGTTTRIARAGAGTKSGPSQMDCIDLTANVTELLLVLDRNKLLKFHRVGEPVSRGLIVDGKQPHTTPVIMEIATGTPWSVDSWTKSYGQSPDIMTISDWKSKN
jgi:hypothetical protein